MGSGREGVMEEWEGGGDGGVGGSDGGVGGRG